MEIKGFVGVSLSDWDGKISSVVFLPNCNLRCPFCYNKSLVLQPESMPTVALDHIERYLETNRKWIDGVAVTGGEPTLHMDLPNLCGKIKDMGFGVKLDTNGTNPNVISKLIDEKLIDYVALDVKAPLTTEKYSLASGVAVTRFLEKVKETVQILLDKPGEHEFRTTLVPGLHQIEDIEAICHEIKGCRKYALQNFKSEVETIDPKFQGVKPFSNLQMAQFLQAAKKIVPNTMIRG